ncbi:hypothetical protein [Staphylococcus aureus]|uniref:hypothetical protein n=1 Tax=Staphylococcus aureus TaxID=1280 RepID=UPI000DFDD46F|nr:hypothetical protein [Staphylococcus aureus]SUL87556.1 Uncharacterised protein [Staphylococcus aureus]
MSLYTKKISENLAKLKELKNVIPNVEFQIDEETIIVELVKKSIKNYKKEKKTIYTLNHTEFPEEHNIVRLYLPLMGEAGYVPTEDEIIQLFTKGSIVPPQNAFVSKQSDEYSVASMEFKPLSENLYKGKPVFYGEIIPHFQEKKS